MKRRLEMRYTKQDEIFCLIFTLLNVRSQFNVLNVRFRMFVVAQN